MVRSVDVERDVVDVARINGWYVENSTAVFDSVALSTEGMGLKIRGLIADGFPFYVFEREGVVRGYCYAHLWKEKQAYFPTWETTIYLHPEERGRGIGRQLMERLIEECRERGCHSLIACITAENIESRRFHESLGFLQVSHFKCVGQKFGRYLDVTDYQLFLN